MSCLPVIQFLIHAEVCLLRPVVAQYRPGRMVTKDQVMALVNEIMPATIVHLLNVWNAHVGQPSMQLFKTFPGHDVLQSI